MSKPTLTPEQMAHNRKVAAQAAYLAANFPNAFRPTRVKGEVKADVLMRVKGTSRVKVVA